DTLSNAALQLVQHGTYPAPAGEAPCPCSSLCPSHNPHSVTFPGIDFVGVRAGGMGGSPPVLLPLQAKMPVISGHTITPCWYTVKLGSQTQLGRTTFHSVSPFCVRLYLSTGAAPAPATRGFLLRLPGRGYAECAVHAPTATGVWCEVPWLRNPQLQRVAP